MQYFKVDWIHEFDDDPVTIFTEIDEQLWERRKVEVFRDESTGFADEHEERGGSMLSVEPWPDLEAMKQDSEFAIEQISKEQFEAQWDRRRLRINDPDTR